MSTVEFEILVSRERAAELLGLKNHTLARWAMDDRYLPVVRCGRAVRYKLSDLDRFIADHTTPAAS